MVALQSTVSLDLPTRIAQLSLSRAAGISHSPATYENLMLDCVEQGRTTYAYRLLEEGAADGLRLSEFSPKARAALDGLIPPEAEQRPTHSSSSSARGHLLVDTPHPLWVRPSAPVRTFDCSSRDPSVLAKAWAAAAKRNEPILFRGVGSSWRALDTWTLDSLCANLRRGAVRISPDSRVTFCRESHPDVRSGALQPPSRTVLMSTHEFVDRLSSNRAGRTPLLYGDDERCYLQALAPHAMMADVDFAFLDYASQPPPLLDDDDDGNEEDGDEGTPNLFGGDDEVEEAEDEMVAEESGGGGTGVLGRLWVSAPGTVSPLHYDLTDSYLCQVRGVKRLLLWPSRDLESLKPYPRDHALARRLQVDVTGEEPPRPSGNNLFGKILGRSTRATAEETAAPHAASTLSRAARRAVESPYEALLRPGDVLYFPKDWAHHTEALAEPVEEGGEPQPSFSLGFRTDGAYLL